MKKTTFQLLPTKLNRPRSRTNLIERADLFQRLNQSLTKRMVLVSAPAGFGKTTLINSWLEQQPFPATWLSLDQADNDPSRFFLYFFAALSKILPEINLLCRENGSFSDKPTKEDILISLIQHLQESPNEYIFVLDDYHLIENPVIHETIKFLIQNLTLVDEAGEKQRKGILPILISRADPRFSLSKWRLQDELTEIRMKDLRVSEEDAKFFLHQTTGATISEKQAKEIVSQTEGWIAGIQMAAISFNEQHLNNLDQFIQEFNGGNHLVAGYLLNEVVSLLPEKLQQFLINTSILDRFSGSLCDAILETDDSQEILESLEKSNLFIIRLDEQRTWYRYHHLLSEYLSKRWVQMAKSSFINLHLRAATWFETNKYLGECIQNYLAVGEVLQAVRIITENASPILNQGKVLYLGELIAYFPEDAFDRWPWLCIYQGWINAIMETGNDEYWMNKAEEIITQNNQPPYVKAEELDEMLGNIAAIRAMCASKRGDIQVTLEAVPRALALLPASTAKVRGLVLDSEGRCQYLNGQLEESQATFLRAREELIVGGNLSGAAESVWMAGQIAFIQGKLHYAESIFKDPLFIAENQRRGCDFMHQSYSGLGKIYYEWNRIDEAQEFLQRGYTGSKKFGISSMIRAGEALINVNLSLREWEKAEAILEELNSNPSTLRIQPFIGSLWSACWIRLFTLTGRYRQAQRLIEERHLRDNQHIEVYREPELLASLEYDQATGAYDVLLGKVSDLLARLEGSGRDQNMIRALLFQTNAYHALGEPGKAQISLTRALDLGRLEEYIRSFIDAGDPVLQLLTELVQNNGMNGMISIDPDYIQEIIAAFIQNTTIPSQCLQKKWNYSANKNTRITVFDSPLTPPEQSILRLLVAGYDNFEIASNQGISINTVKTHISHIFGKLGVHNRVQASNRAKMLGLVE